MDFLILAWLTSCIDFNFLFVSLGNYFYFTMGINSVRRKKRPNVLPFPGAIVAALTGQSHFCPWEFFKMGYLCTQILKPVMQSMLANLILQ